MTDSEDAEVEPEAEAQPQHEAVGWYRQRPGRVWLVAAVLIPLLLAVIGYGLARLSGPEDGTPTGTLPTLAQTSLPPLPPAPPRSLMLAPLSIVRSGEQITIDGAMPNAEAERVLQDTVLGAFGRDVNIVDTVSITPDVKALDFSSARAFFDAVAGVPDFSLVVGGDTVTLGGTAEAAADLDAVEAAATKAWPLVNIVNTMVTNGPLTAPAAPPGR